jgi:uncharacterized membrane protein YccC
VAKLVDGVEPPRRVGRRLDGPRFARQLRQVSENSSVRVGTKMAMASGLSWWLGGLAVHGPASAAAMAPLIAFRNEDPWNVWHGIIGRLFGVVLGVGAAVCILALSRPSTWWVVLIVVVTAAIQAIPHVGERLVHNWQIAVSAILVLGIGQGTYGGERLVETLVGGGVTLLVASLVWPPDPVGELRRRLTRAGQTLGEDLRQVPRLLGVDVDAAHAFEAGVIQHGAFCHGAVTNIEPARQSLRYSVRRWNHAEQALTEVAGRLERLSGLYHLVETLAHDLVHLARQGERLDDDGRQPAYETAVAALVSAVERLTDGGPSREPSLVERVDALAAPAGPWTAVVTAGIRELAGWLDAPPGAAVET